MNIPELSKGARQLGWTSCLTLASKETLPGGTTFHHIHKHFGSPNRDNYRSDECQEMPRLEFKAEICNEEVKINFEKPTVI